MRSFFATLRSLTIPAGAGPNAPRIEIGGPIPADLIAYYASKVPAYTVVGGIIEYESATVYTYQVAIDRGDGVARWVSGGSDGTDIVEITRLFTSGGFAEFTAGNYGDVNTILGVNSTSVHDVTGQDWFFNSESIVVPQTWTPAWTQAVDAGRALGNGTIVGRYLKQGDLCWVYIRLQIGSTTTFGTGNFLFSLPFAPGLNLQTLNGFINDTSVAAGKWTASARIVTATNNIDAIVAGSGLGFVTQAVPMVWANGDQLVITGHYVTA